MNTFASWECPETIELEQERAHSCLWWTCSLTYLFIAHLL